MDISITAFSKILLNVSILLLAICSVLFLRNWKQNIKAYKLLTVYLVFVTLIQFTFTISFTFSPQTWVLANIFFVGQMLFLYFYFLNVFKKKIFINYLKIYTSCFFIFLISLFAYNPYLFFNLNEVLASLLTFGYISFTLLYCYETIGKKIEGHNLIIAGLVYHFGSIFVFLIADILYKNSIFLALIIYNYHTLLAIIYSLFVFREWKINIYNKNKF